MGAGHPVSDELPLLVQLQREGSEVLDDLAALADCVARDVGDHPVERLLLPEPSDPRVRQDQGVQRAPLRRPAQIRPLVNIQIET